MDKMLKGLLVIASVFAIAASGTYLWKTFGSTGDAAYGQAATPRRIDMCEQAIADIQVSDAATWAEGRLKAAAVDLVRCDQYGLLDRTTKLHVRQGPIGPYFDAFAANPEVWSKPTG